MPYDALRLLRAPVACLWYTLSPCLDAKPDELIAAALAHARLGGRAPVCLAASFALTATDVERLTREEPVNGLVSKHNPLELRRLQKEFPAANVGGYWEPGLWLLPPGAAHVYFIGSWRLITLAMLREALRRQVLTLTVRCGREWVDIPLDAIRKLAVSRRITLRAARLLSIAHVWRAVFWIPPRSAPGKHAAASENPLGQAWSEMQRNVVRGLAASRLLCRARRLPGRLVRRISSTIATGTTSTQLAGAPAASPLGKTLLTEMISAAAAERRADFVAGRVVLVCGNLSPGGAERQVAYTARGLAQVPGIESVELLCDMLSGDHPGRHDFYLPLLQRAGVPARTIDQYAFGTAMVTEPAALARSKASLPEDFLVDVANLYQELIRLRPEVMHAWLDWSNTRAGLAAALAGVPRIVLSGRNVNPTHFALYQPYMDPVYEALCALPNVVLLNNSRAGAESYAEWLRLAPDRIKVIYNGLDMGPIDDDAASEVKNGLGIPQDAPLVGGVFRFYPEKRPLLWVEVAARVLRAQPDTWFVLFGQGILEPQIAKAARDLGIGQRLILPGITGDVLPVMRALDVFLLTSYGEGVPNVVLEAQWAGTPVVATRAGGVSEALDLGMSGWIVDPPDADQLAGCVSWLLGDPGARAQARSAGPELIRARFGLQRMIDETAQAYDLRRQAISGISRDEPARLDTILGEAYPTPIG
jgi:glycosyltransferase involved in cell wall biosynthesis